MLAFLFLDFMTVRQVYLHSSSGWLRGITVVGAVLQVVLYLLVAISNPGITTSVDFDTETDE